MQNRFPHACFHMQLFPLPTKNRLWNLSLILSTPLQSGLVDCFKSCGNSVHLLGTHERANLSILSEETPAQPLGAMQKHICWVGILWHSVITTSILLSYVILCPVLHQHPSPNDILCPVLLQSCECYSESRWFGVIQMLSSSGQCLPAGNKGELMFTIDNTSLSLMDISATFLANW
jgi:hypothetical protein